MNLSIQRTQTSFRLRTDVLDILKKKAAKANRTLNSYVENLLVEDAFPEEPNETTKAAINEAMSMSGSQKDTYSSVGELMAELMK